MRTRSYDLPGHESDAHDCCVLGGGVPSVGRIGMDKVSVAIEALRVRAEALKSSAEHCTIPRYSELLHKGARHLQEQAHLLEARLECRRPVGLEAEFGISEMDC